MRELQLSEKYNNVLALFLYFLDITAFGYYAGIDLNANPPFEILSQAYTTPWSQMAKLGYADTIDDIISSVNVTFMYLNCKNELVKKNKH